MLASGLSFTVPFWLAIIGVATYIWSTAVDD